MELSAVAEQGHPPLPTYRATVRNASDRPVRRVIATVVYLDANGRALPGENQDVAFGSPLEAIDPGVTIETMFLSRVDSAPEVRLVVKTSSPFSRRGREPTRYRASGRALATKRSWQRPKAGADHATRPLGAVLGWYKVQRFRVTEAVHRTARRKWSRGPSRGR